MMTYKDVLLGTFIGILFGAVITYAVMLVRVNQMLAPIKELIAECEAKLPRDQTCYIKLVPRESK
jgi:hypothetical protein